MNKNDIIDLPRRIVCAANRDKSGAVILGARHWDQTMHAAFAIWREAKNHVTRDMRFIEQGFIDQYGAFLNRQEAWKVAEAAGQIIRRVGGDDTDGGTLYSENLY